jgi:hypothetical protein
LIFQRYKEEKEKMRKKGNGTLAAGLLLTLLIGGAISVESIIRKSNPIETNRIGRNRIPKHGRAQIIFTHIDNVYYHVEGRRYDLAQKSIDEARELCSSSDLDTKARSYFAERFKAMDKYIVQNRKREK